MRALHTCLNAQSLLRNACPRRPAMALDKLATISRNFCRHLAANDHDLFVRSGSGIRPYSYMDTAIAILKIAADKEL